MALCACGCGQPLIEKRWHKYTKAQFLPHHNMASAHEAARRHFTETRPAPSACACGCGELTTVNGRRVARYVAGHYRRPPTGRKPRMLDSNGYVLIYAPDYPGAQKSGYVPEHRKVWEQANGRRLESWEHVHHINGDIVDNRPENLMALSRRDHMLVHERNPNGFTTSEQKSGFGRKGAAVRWGKVSP